MIGGLTIVNQILRVSAPTAVDLDCGYAAIHRTAKSQSRGEKPHFHIFTFLNSFLRVSASSAVNPDCGAAAIPPTAKARRRRGLLHFQIFKLTNFQIFSLPHFQIFKFSNFPIRLLAFFLPISAQAQSLLLNGGFEEENTCTEYNVECAPEAWMSNANGFNNYFEDANRAHAGLRCMAIEAGHSSKPYHRTFLRSRLLCGLRKGHAYRLEFYLKSPHDVLDSMGVIFTPHDFMYESRKLQHLEPTFFVQPAEGEFRNDSSWQRVVVDFTANGTESFLSIANFSKRDITGNTGIAMVKNFFVFVDDVSLQPLDPNEMLCDGWQKSKQDIYDQNERHQYLQRLIKMHRNNPPVV